MSAQYNTKDNIKVYISTFTTVKTQINKKQWYVEIYKRLGLIFNRFNFDILFFITSSLREIKIYSSKKPECSIQLPVNELWAVFMIFWGLFLFTNQSALGFHNLLADHRGKQKLICYILIVQHLV